MSGVPGPAPASSFRTAAEIGIGYAEGVTERLFLRLEGDASHGPESSAPAGTLLPGAINPALRGHVSQLLLYREQLPPDSEVVERVVPDGAVRLVFNLGDAPPAASGGARRVVALGASLEPAIVRLSGRMEGVSVALRPGAAAAILGAPASELEGRAIDLDDLWQGEGSRLLERMAEAADDTTRLALLDAALLGRLARTEDAAAARTARAAALIAESGGRLPLSEVARAVGVGERRLQQLFKEHVGLAPRGWSRLSRLHACLRLLRKQPRPTWAEVAADAGYYDQAHLVNEFRSLCGLSPTSFVALSISGSSKTPS